jgi:hypothetical protein
MPARSSNPTLHALAVRHYRELRRKGFAFTHVAINWDVIDMLVRRGKLANHDVHSRKEIRDAVTAFLLEEAEKW